MVLCRRKDRCGLVSAAIGHCPGTSDAQITDDYMLINEYPIALPQLAAIEQMLPENQKYVRNTTDTGVIRRATRVG